jgi:CHAT domain-containing protein/tetratricopeptide (TPR) repeat protein
MVFFTRVAVCLLAVFFLMSGCSYVDRNMKKFDRSLKEFQDVRENLRNHRYADALSHSLQNLKLTEERTGRDSIYTAGVLNDIGNIYIIIGDYEAAEPVLQRALAIREKRLNRDNPDLAVSLNNLGVVCQHTGDYEKAVGLYTRALEINGKYVGPNHFDAITNMTNAAHVYLLLGKLQKAENMARRAMDTVDKLLGRNNHYLAGAEDIMGRIYLRRGDLDNAETHFQTAIEILERISTGGLNDPAVAECLAYMAEIHLRRNELPQAEKALQKARSSLERTLGEHHPALAGINEKLALIRGEREDYREAAVYLEKALISDERVVDQAVGFSSEQKKLRFLASQRKRLDEYLSLVAHHMINDPAMVDQAFNAWLRRKGLVLDAQRRFQEALFLDASPEARTVFQELAIVRRQLSNLFFSALDRGNPDEKLKMIADLEIRKDQLESRLGQISRAYAASLDVDRSDTRKLQKTIPKDAFLIEFARIRWTDFRKPFGSESKQPGRYLAFTLPPEGRASMLDLGPADEIDRTVSAYKNALMDSLLGSGSDVTKLSRKLHDLIFRPLKPVIGSAKYIYLSPDDVLNLMPFEVLQGPDGRFLIEDFTFNYLNVGRDLARREPAGTSSATHAVLLGDPDFDLMDGDRKAVLRRLGLPTTDRHAELRGSTEMRGMNFAPLPETKEEVEAIKNVLGPDRTEVFTGAEALEEVVRKKAGCSILHLATHGFFLKDTYLTDFAGDALIETSLIDLDLVRTANRAPLMSPLLRSGLALAGANQTLRGDKMIQGDGLLTAEKVLGLGLGETELVVLSACETGVGEVQSGEGVFGLRRAFTQAGAKSMVMSLWSVPDKETKELMEEMYRQIGSGRVNRAEALRRAALKEMRTVKTRYGEANPIFWGAFVFLGVP